MASVMSKKLKEILQDPIAKEDLAKKIFHSKSQFVINIGNKTYQIKNVNPADKQTK